MFEVALGWLWYYLWLYTPAQIVLSSHKNHSTHCMHAVVYCACAESLCNTLTFQLVWSLRGEELLLPLLCLQAAMTSQTTVIPGLFSSEQSNLSTTSSAPGLFSISTTSVNTAANTTDGSDRFIHLRGSALIVELTNEKDSLDARFIHSKRLIDEG